MKSRILYCFFFLLFCSNMNAQQLIQGTIKPGPTANQVEIWLKPNFNNTTKYLYQILLPITFPSNISPQPTGLTVNLDAGFIATFGNNYTVSQNPLAQNTSGTEKYFNIFLIRNGPSGSSPQTWTSGTEFKVLTATFTYSSTSAVFQAKLADYQDGGSDGLGNFYTVSGNSNYYITSNSIGNFYASAGQSVTGGNSAAGYAQIIAPCPQPSFSTINNITTTSADITWSAVTGAAGYQYAITNSIIPPASGTTTTNTFYNAAGLTINTIYYFHVRTQCVLGNFSAWQTTQFITLCTAPPVPVVTNITSIDATLTWAVVPGVTGYQYVVTTSPVAPASGTTTTNTTINLTGLNFGTKYYVYVRSNCSTGAFSNWSLANFITLCKPPAVPVVTNITNSADISWNNVGGTATGYEYAVTTDATPPTSGTFTTATAYHVTNLISYTTYYVHVRTSCGAGGFSSWVRGSFATSCFKPIPYLIANSTNAGTADIGWDAVHGAIKYEYAVLKTAASPIASLVYTTDPFLNLTGLRLGAKYFLHVRTHCSVTNISDWSILEFNTSGVAVYPNPVNDKVTIKVIGALLPNGEICILDPTGRIMNKTRLNGNSIVIDMRAYAAGIYFVRYGNDKGFVTKLLKR